jgi:hypothetical protein
LSISSGVRRFSNARMTVCLPNAILLRRSVDSL